LLLIDLHLTNNKTFATFYWYSNKY